FREVGRLVCGSLVRWCLWLLMKISPRCEFKIFSKLQAYCNLALSRIVYGKGYSYIGAIYLIF
ncbi:MAG TPA: hypothetical protein VEP90_27290, partial [Methylomirabilota bacterium]|nr:hypothetical protein [Methylomirabilota bacterium]